MSPTTRIVKLPWAPLPDGIDGLILTSANAIRSVAALDLGSCAGMVAWCVGDRTAIAARAAGLLARSASGDAAALVDLIAQEAPGTHLVHLRGETVAADIAGELARAGVRVTERIVYRQGDCPLSGEAREALAGPSPVILPLFSPSAARRIASDLPVAAPLHVVAISPAAAKAAEPLRAAAVIVADRPDMAAMVAATHAAIGAA